MSLKYTKIRKNPIIFNRLFGISVSQFEEILLKIEPQWQKQVINRYKRPGRDYKLELADMLLLLLLYYRSYITQMFVGFLFGIDDSRVCRIIQKLEPILAKGMALTKTKYLSQEEVETLIIDATEQPIERPQRAALFMFPDQGAELCMILHFIKKNLPSHLTVEPLLILVIKVSTKYIRQLNCLIKRPKQNHWIKRKKNTTTHCHVIV
jgi:hypothetical protein